MKNKHIIKDILRNYPELEKDKKTLQKTVEFLMVSQPKVQIDQKFKSHLGEKLSTLAVMKSGSVESFVKKPLLLHVFGGVFASLLAFFGLFYVFGDGLFYTGSTPQISEYEAQISDIDTVQETKLEIRSTGGISEPTEETSIPNTQVEQKVPNTIIINQDGALQIDVSEKQQLKILPVEESTTDRSQDIVSDDVPQDIIPNQESNLDFADAIGGADTPDVSNGTMIMDQIGEDDDSMERDLPMPANQLMESFVEPHSEDDAGFSPEAIEEDIAEVQSESIDEFTLRCDVFGGEVSIKDDIRVCNIGDIVCSESDFLEGVCELGK